MILLDRVTKTYGKDMKPALNRVSLHVEPNEFVIIVGTSGAGKSTLLKLLTREEKPTSGKIVVGGIDYDQLKDKHIPLLRRKIGSLQTLTWLSSLGRFVLAGVPAAHSVSAAATSGR